MSAPLYTVTIACTACGACLRTCPEHCIRPAAAGSRAPLVVLDTCSGCGECAEICPVEACVEVWPWAGERSWSRSGSLGQERSWLVQDRDKIAKDRDKIAQDRGRDKCP